jgi:hypothetical protein
MPFVFGGSRERGEARPRRALTEPAPRDWRIAIFLFGTFATLGGIRALGVDPAGFNTDCYMATAWARHYLASPDFHLSLHDIYTQGFVHPLLYIPILGILGLLGVPSHAQDDLAISAVYSISVGLITALAFLCARAYLRREVAGTCAVITVLVLALGSANDHDRYSPNAEILGTVIILLLWYLLIMKEKIKRWLPAFILLGTLGFHLKYQLIAIIFPFLWLSDIKFRQKRAITIYLTIAIFAVDLAVYRLNGEGLLSRIPGLIQYTTLGAIGGGKIPVGEQLASQFFDQLDAILIFIPQIVIAWLFWVYALSTPFAAGRFAMVDLRACVLMLAAALIAIFLPGKGFVHYYLLLMPVSTFVMVMALRNARPCCNPRPLGPPTNAVL